MIAAIYARKSTDQHVADEAKSVTRQIAHARAGYVSSGRVFGYDKIEVRSPSGRRDHVERRVNEAEAVIVRRIFTRSLGA